ncbi:hypothetical protein BH09PAT2_BH09PAT2_05170 [soil metagenome]
MKKILLIEDDIFLKQLYTDVLTQEGYEVDTADEGNIAIKKIQENKWDLILLDVLLPNMDGFHVLDHVKKGYAKLHCPVIFMTNLDSNDEDKEKLEKADGYWIKSEMSPPEFIEKVKNVIK